MNKRCLIILTLLPCYCFAATTVVPNKKPLVESSISKKPTKEDATQMNNMRRERLVTQIKNVGLDNLIKDYEAKIQNFKKEGIYADYPELMGEYHYDLLDLYAMQFGKLYDIKNYKQLEGIVKKMDENRAAAITAYRKAGSEYKPFIEMLKKYQEYTLPEKPSAPAETGERKRLREQIKKSNPQRLTGVIDGLKIAAFSTRSAIGKGYDNAQVDKFALTTDVLNEMILEEVNAKKLPREYSDYIIVFKKLRNSILGSLPKLVIFKSFFPPDKKDSSKSQFVVQDKKLIREYSGNLRKIKNELMTNMNVTKSIGNALMRQRISEVKEYPSDWARQFHKNSNMKSTIKTLGRYFPNNQTIIFANESRLTKKLDMNKIIKAYKTKVLKKTNLTNEEVADDLVNRLEGVEYILDQKVKSYKSKTSIYYKKDLTKLTKIKYLIGEIKDKYSDIITSLDAQKLYMSTNKMATGLSIELNSMVEVGGQLLKEVSLLYNAA